MVQNNTRQGNVNVTVEAKIGWLKKTNRHGTKIFSIGVCCYQGVEKKHYQEFDDVECRVMKDKTISWKFPLECPEVIEEAVKNLYTAEEICEYCDSIK